MKRIKLVNRGFALVDDFDYPLLKKRKWYNSGGYARSYWTRRFGKAVLMHRLIMSAPKDRGVDHINGNTLDNRKQNLRLCTQKQNLRNVSKHKDNKSGYKGVYFSQGKWRADIMASGVRRFLGLFSNKIKAAKAYDRAAKLLNGKFAKTNFRK